MSAAPYLVTSESELEPAGELSIALIGPDDQRRRAAAQALADSRREVREFTSYPKESDDLPRLLDSQYDVVILDLDGDPKVALALVESISMSGKSTVMVYSHQNDPQLLMRCMRAGAREFLPVPLNPAVVSEALSRAAVRRPTPAIEAKVEGKLLVFMGAKGGVGVTSVASNFAVALAQDAKQKTILIDLDLPLGDAALNFGIVPEFSTVDALRSADRLDAALLTRLLVQHSSGVWVLAAPGKFPHYEPDNDSLEKLIAVARQEFDYVVIDAGARLDTAGSPLFANSATVYLVTQAGIPELRNANRLINQIFAAGDSKLEVVLNRFDTRPSGITEEHITKALTRPAQWKIPNDHGLVRKMQINASPLVLGDSSLAKMIRQMAESVNPKSKPEKKKKGFSLFG